MDQENGEYTVKDSLGAGTVNTDTLEPVIEWYGFFTSEESELTADDLNPIVGKLDAETEFVPTVAFYNVVKELAEEAAQD